MLSYIKSLGPNEELFLKLISRKLVVLLALMLAHRCSDLDRLTLHGRGGCTTCAGLAKQAKQESLRPAVIFHFPHDTSLCPVFWFKVYEKATTSLSEKRKLAAFLATKYLASFPGRVGGEKTYDYSGGDGESRVVEARYLLFQWQLSMGDP